MLEGKNSSTQNALDSSNTLISCQLGRVWILESPNASIFFFLCLFLVFSFPLPSTMAPSVLVFVLSLRKMYFFHGPRFSPCAFIYLLVLPKAAVTVYVLDPETLTLIPRSLSV